MDTTEDVDSASDDDTISPEDKEALFVAHAKIRESLEKRANDKRQMTFFSRWLRRVSMARIDHLCLASIAAFSSLSKKTLSSAHPRARDALATHQPSPPQLDQLSRQQLVEVAGFLIPDVLVPNQITSELQHDKQID